MDSLSATAFGFGIGSPWPNPLALLVSVGTGAGAVGAVLLDVTPLDVTPLDVAGPDGGTGGVVDAIAPGVERVPRRPSAGEAAPTTVVAQPVRTIPTSPATTSRRYVLLANGSRSMKPCVPPTAHPRILPRHPPIGSP
ncbi:hypothetical protein D1871_00820 [Nakamurella silvestris]|nr:hypothetical protein D1871_00820 [Nakamurella silvestris]